MNQIHRRFNSFAYNNSKPLQQQQQLGKRSNTNSSHPVPSKKMAPAHLHNGRPSKSKTHRKNEANIFFDKTVTMKD